MRCGVQWMTSWGVVSAGLLLMANAAVGEDRRPWGERDKYPPSGYSYQAESYYVVPPYVGPGSSVFIPPPVLLSREPVIPAAPLYIDPVPNGAWRGDGGFQQPRSRLLPPSPEGNWWNDASGQPFRSQPTVGLPLRPLNRPSMAYDPAFDGYHRRPLSAGQYAAQRRFAGPNRSVVRYRNGW
jgi:hypothetical protein